MKTAPPASNLPYADPHILVVDGDPEMRSLAGRWLTEAGFQVLTAATARQALAALKAYEIECAIVDVNLPNRTGVELVTQIRKRLADTEVVVCSSADDTSPAVNAMALGAFSFLLKPMEPAALVDQIHKALDNRRSIIARRRYTSTLETTVREQVQTIRRAHEETILRLLSASRYRDEETGAHIKRTGLYGELFAEVLGWPADEVRNIRMAAPMHDLGKIGIPDSILQKPGKLTAEEFAVMKTHTTIGARMLEGSASPMLQMAHEIALCHHERWDGSGYPNGLSGLAIPETARIVALADVYDALTHRRVYHAAKTEEEAVDIMEAGRGKHFDPFLFSIFLALLPEIRRISAEHPDEAIDGYVRHAAAVSS